MESSQAPRIQPEQLLRLVNTKGPPPKLEHGPDHDAVFDPFEFEGEEFFLHYMGGIYCWMVRRPLPPADRRYPDETRFGCPSETLELMSALAFMPPPSLPDRSLSPAEELTNDTFQGPFWYRGSQFLWWLKAGSTEWWPIIFSSPPEEPAQEAIAVG